MITKSRKNSTAKNLVSTIKKAIKINKSNEIRKIAESMNKRGVDPKGFLIIKALAKKKIKVSGSHVSYALNRKLKRKKNNCTVNDLIIVRDFLKSIGGIDRAEMAIKVYKKFKI